jgi:hypothetical protein
MTFVLVVLFVVSAIITGSIFTDNGGTGNALIDNGAFIVTIVTIYLMGKSGD